MLKYKFVDLSQFDGLYEAKPNGNIVSKRSGVTLNPQVNKWGYCHVLVRNGNGKSFFISVHRLVCHQLSKETFSETNCVINHRNGMKGDNRLENLEWCSPSYNMKHAVKTGLHKAPKNYGKKNGMYGKTPSHLSGCRKLSEFQVKRLRLIKEISPSMRGEDIGKLFNISKAQANGIISRLYWKNL